MSEQTHNIPPVYDESSRLLILGSFPSVKSRESGFFYGHPRNRFWQVTAELFGAAVPTSIDEKKRLLLDNRVALWDVVAACSIDGSSDASISEVRVNDISRILSFCPIKAIFTNGSTAARLYKRYLLPLYRRSAYTLPSTSPANAVYSVERLAGEWKRVISAATAE